MGRDIVKNLKFKKHTGKHFDPELFANLLDESYRNTKRADGEMTKKSFSPSSLGYGHGTCPRYWYMAFSGAMFIDDNDAVAVANMAQGTQAHERLQKLISTMPQFVAEEEEGDEEVNLDEVIRALREMNGDVPAEDEEDTDGMTEEEAEEMKSDLEEAYKVIKSLKQNPDS
jgi:hypothetical protein